MMMCASVHWVKYVVDVVDSVLLLLVVEEQQSSLAVCLEFVAVAVDGDDDDERDVDVHGDVDSLQEEV